MKKIKNALNRPKRSNFIGKQLTRLKNGMSYFTFFASIISVVALVKIAYPSIEFEELVLYIVPFFTLGAYFFGYFTDITGIKTFETKKQIEISHRYLNTADIKSQEFQMMLNMTQTSILLEQQTGKILTPDIIQKRYDENYLNYQQKWKEKNK